MNFDALDTCLALERAHAALAARLDDALGTWHGLDWRDFVLLDVLANAPGERLLLRALAAPLGMGLSGLVRRLAPLEKLGLLGREGEGAARMVVLRPGGRRLWNEARDTAGDICAGALAGVPSGALDAERLEALARSPALRLA